MSTLYLSIGTVSATSLRNIYPRKYSIRSKVEDIGKRNWASQVKALLEGLNLSDAFVNASDKMEMLALAGIWESLASKIFHRWEACVWDVGALAFESGGKLAVYGVLKDIPAAKPYARANLPVWVQRVLA